MTGSDQGGDTGRPSTHLCLFCGRMRDRQRVCCGPRQDIAICLDCAELAVEVIRTDLPA